MQIYHIFTPKGLNLQKKNNKDCRFDRHPYTPPLLSPLSLSQGLFLYNGNMISFGGTSQLMTEGHMKSESPQISPS